ncbi:hypothetical protein RIF29_03913 [Crotalaria pallida]|uniref:Replication factor A C-terminal domain-containing protein n=1 Tax=Crotalaria pallida TaxID=3830 RepID=A0AAN9J0F5_CROPI
MLSGGIQLSPCTSVILGPSKMSIEDEYLKHFPKKTIDNVNSCPEDVVVIVLGTINAIVDDGQWWYPACKCHKAVVADNGVYYCHTCVRHVFNVTPRYKLQIEVSDHSGSAILILFDYDVYYLICKSCADLLASMPQGSKAIEYPVEFKSMVGRKLLFKVANTAVGSISAANVSGCGRSDLIASSSQGAEYDEEVIMTVVSLADDSTPCEDLRPNNKRAHVDVFGETSTKKVDSKEKGVKI